MRERQARPTDGTCPTIASDNIDELLTLDIEDGDDERLHLKEAIRALSLADRRTLCYYAELRSYRKMAEVLGASATTWRRELNRIRGLIKAEL